MGGSLRGGIARNSFSVIVADTAAGFEDEVAIAASGAHDDHHRTAVPYFAADTSAGPKAPR